MWLKSIEASRFRQFRDTVSVHDLAPGLNIIAGANEEGKSTLLRVIRATLFDRYTSSVVHVYRPYGEHVSPRVRLVFKIEGTEYTLDKVFSRKRDGQATLSASNGQRWEGPQAEEFLAEQLGFTYARRGASKAEHQGLAGLLWVEQARAFEQVSLNDHSRRQLHTVFDAQMSELLGGEHGETLHRRIAELRSIYFDKRGKPRGEYRQLQKRQNELASSLEQNRQDLLEYEAKAQRLEELQSSLQAYRDERIVDEAQDRLRQALASQARVQAMEDRISAARDKLALAKADEEAARLNWATRMELIDEQQRARLRLAQGREHLTRKRENLDPVMTSVQKLKKKISALKQGRHSKEAQLRRARETEKSARIKTQLQALRTNFDQALTAQRAKLECQAQRDAIAVTREALTELRIQDRDRALAEERLHAAATRLDYALQPSAAVRLGGEMLEARGSVRVTQIADLEVDGIGTFTIHPGGQDLHELHEQAVALSSELQNRLIGLGMEGLDEAEAALNRREALDSKAKQHAARLNALAPQGLAALEDRMTGVEKQYEVLQTKHGEGDEHTGDPAQLEGELRSLSDGIERLEAELSEREEVTTQCREELVAARTSLKAQQSRLDGADHALEAVRSEKTDAALATALADAQRNTELRQRELSALEVTLLAENPQAVAVEVERLERVLEQVKDEYQRLKTEFRDLTVELNTLGQRGLAEEFAQAQGEHASVQRELAHNEAQAQAADLLHRTLDEALRSAKEAVAQPIIAKLLPYLRQLIPGADPCISEDMMLTGIRRQSMAEPFEDLSIGTREQLAVLVRLAYADLLADKGKPVTVILDDALVNSDDLRRDRMKSILYQAAKRYQILVLTCHAKEYRDSGGKFIALSECKVGR